MKRKGLDSTLPLVLQPGKCIIVVNASQATASNHSGEETRRKKRRT